MARHESLSAKCDLTLPPATPLDPELDSLLRSYFSGSLIEELTTVGGTLSINVATAKNKRKDASIDSSFISFLTTFKGDERELKDRLEPLSTRQLANIARHLKVPVRSKSNASELMRGIVSAVLSSHRWKAISGSSAPENRGGGAAAE
jgi:hypothetical protein